MPKYGSVRGTEFSSYNLYNSMVRGQIKWRYYRCRNVNGSYGVIPVHMQQQQTLYVHQTNSSHDPISDDLCIFSAVRTGRTYIRVRCRELASAG